ncbi:MAG: cytochrome C oxidase subunit IV family protein [Planctomycetes bacterium]|nr:cytochrome C oxidase subunit IV family protein [Planctomycetota bacterium]
MSGDHNTFNATRVLILLAVLTAVEVGWALVHEPLGIGIWPMRLGLIFLAIWKGYLIFMFFMHMKFEGWILKGLMVPTLPLMCIVVFANMPDTSFNDKIVYPIGSMASSDGAEVVELEDVSEMRGVLPHNAASHEAGGH